MRHVAYFSMQFHPKPTTTAIGLDIVKYHGVSMGCLNCKVLGVYCVSSRHVSESPRHSGMQWACRQEQLKQLFAVVRTRSTAHSVDKHAGRQRLTYPRSNYSRAA